MKEPLYCFGDSIEKLFMKDRGITSTTWMVTPLHCTLIKKKNPNQVLSCKFRSYNKKEINFKGRL